MAKAAPKLEAKSETVPLWQQQGFVQTTQPDGAIHYKGRIFQADNHPGDPTGGIEIEIKEFHIPGIIPTLYDVTLFEFGDERKQVKLTFPEDPTSVDDALVKAATHVYRSVAG